MLTFWKRSLCTLGVFSLRSRATDGGPVDQLLCANAGESESGPRVRLSSMSFDGFSLAVLQSKTRTHETSFPDRNRVSRGEQATGADGQPETLLRSADAISRTSKRRLLLLLPLPSSPPLLEKAETSLFKMK